MGSHFKLINSEVRDLTPDLAAEFSAMAASVSERDLKPKRLKYLKDAVLGGTAISFSWSRVRIAGTSELYRVNGHHSSTVLTSLNGQFPEGLKVHIDDYEVPDKESVALLFRQFDSRLSTRTVDDISGAYQGLYQDLADVPKQSARAAIEGAGWWMRKVVGDDIPAGDDRFELFNRPALHPFIQMVGRIHGSKTPEFTAPVIGTMFGTWEREPSQSEEFWAAVAKQGGGNDANHPTTVLDAWLVDARDKKVDRPKEMEIHWTCVIAWNAYRHHRTLDRIGKFAAKKGWPDLE